MCKRVLFFVSLLFILKSSCAPDLERVAVDTVSEELESEEADSLTFFGDGDVHNAIYDVAWSPKGKYLAAAGADRVVRIWRSDGERKYNLEGHTDKVSNVMWIPPRHVLSTSHDRVVRTWNIRSREKNVVDDHSLDDSQIQLLKIPFGMDYYAPSAQLALGLSVGEIALTDLITAQPLCQFVAHENYVDALCYTADGLLVSGGDNVLRIWDLRSGKYSSLEGHTRNVSSIAVRPDGIKIVSAGDGGELFVWDQRYNKIFHRNNTKSDDLLGPHQGQVTVSWGNDKTFISSDIASLLRVWHDDGSDFRQRNVNKGSIYTLDCHPEDDVVAIGGQQGASTLSIVDLLSISPDASEADDTDDRDESSEKTPHSPV